MAKGGHKPGMKTSILSEALKQGAILGERNKFFEPKIGFCERSSCVFLSFKTSLSISLALKRPHVVYEGGSLTGPLKGVNLPVESWLSWWNKVKTDEENPITEPEMTICRILGALSMQGNHEALNILELRKFRVLYLIAHIDGDNSSLLHEWAHSRFYFDKKCKESAENSFNHLPERVRSIIIQDLRLRGYREEAYIDEFFSYVVETPSEFGKKLTVYLEKCHHLFRGILDPIPIVEKICFQDFITARSSKEDD